MQPIKLSLQGPFSPLEHKVLCAYRNGSMKLANVDPESVNAILLDQTPSDLSDQWMVAGQVAMSASGKTTHLFLSKYYVLLKITGCPVFTAFYDLPLRGT